MNATATATVDDPAWMTTELSAVKTKAQAKAELRRARAREMAPGLKELLTERAKELVMQREMSDEVEYTPAVHEELCRQKVLGFSDKTAARAVGVTLAKLREWWEAYPELKADMERLPQVALAYCSKRILQMAAGDGPTAFNAAKFVLQTHTEEFQERKKIDVTIEDSREVARSIREGLYGLGGDGEVIDAEVGEVEEVRPKASGETAGLLEAEKPAENETNGSVSETTPQIPETPPPKTITWENL